MITPKSFVEARIYQNEEAVVQDAIRHLLRSRPDLKIRLVIYQYQKQNISLEKAANIVGVSWAQMKDILTEHGISLRMGPETMPEALEEVDFLREKLNRQ